ncbi:actin family [Mucor mucedo]|uniref:actin family n=1 Tax=Mucor mucedo TaxID=29922 RepID=UPI00221F0554|nr:actin family [Mucor mucedo]KAI7893256.1 actin family [Mucor mucedo]
MVAYGGDEVNALVLDVGSTMTRAGYAGEDTPRVMFPTSVGYLEENPDVVMAEEDTEPQPSLSKRKYYIGDNKINKFKSNMEVKNPMHDGMVEDWEAMEHIWDAALNDMLRIDPENHPLLCTEPAWNTKEKREKTMELAFEKFRFPAFYLAQDAVMTAFSVGRATALVLDSGGGVTSAVPVYDGFVLKRGILHQTVAGDTLANQIKRQLKKDLDYTITPHYKIAKKNPVTSDQQPDVQLRDLQGITESFNDYQTTKVVNEYKETICEVSDTTFDEEILGSRSKKSFEFPDGFNHAFGLERYKVPETLFQPHIHDEITTAQEEEERTEEEGVEPKNKLLGVHDMVFNSINHCDIDLRPLLFNNIVVTGGNTLFPGFNERLNYELPLKAPGSKIKIHAAGNATERKSSSWLGGSILASLGTFHQLWVSRKEYEEFGASIVHRKC